jgi:Tol biopolymer transport system component/TolB-like protein/Tfp pilus assembly protein PilF
MEYIEGQPVRQYSDSQKLPIVERLRLFRKICAAVHYAHQKMIIHRDIKPGNILVTTEGTPKLLDFGIAKILDPEITSRVLEPTTATSRLMTPQYASPEQIRGEEVTAASDIYSLGVLLYELLSGHRPYRFRYNTALEIARVICEEEPERPSVAINLIEVIPVDGGEPIEIAPDTVSEARGCTLEQLHRQLSGTLDSIVLKTLRKDPGQRYSSAEDLAADLKRYLDGLPVLIPSFPAPPQRPDADSGDQAARSLAVLPFKVLTAEEKTDEFLGMGMADAIITKLSMLRRIMVRPTSAILKYFDGEHNVITAGYELNVEYVLDGRIQRAGDRVRVTVQLIRVSDSMPIWGAKFDESFTDIFAVEDSISELVAQALVPRLTGEERALLLKRETDNPDAYQAYLKARYYWNRFTDEDFGKALELLKEAIRLDPGYAMAYVGLADWFNWSAIYGMGSPRDFFPQAKEAAQKAIELDDTLADAHAALGFTVLCYEWDWAGADRIFERALELNPHSDSVHHWYSYLLASEGRFDEAIAEIKLTQELNPLSLMNKSMTGYNYYQARRYDLAEQELRKIFELDRNFGNAYLVLGMVLERKGFYDEAIEAMRKSLELMPGSIVPLWALGHCLGVAGRESEARQVLAELEDHSQEHYASPYYFALIHAGLGDMDRAMEWLEKACDARECWLIWLGTEPKLDPLRVDPRFNKLMERAGTPRPDRATQGAGAKILPGHVWSGLQGIFAPATIPTASTVSLTESQQSGAQAVAREAFDTVRIIPAPDSDSGSLKAGSRSLAWVARIAAVLVLAVASLLVYRLAGRRESAVHFQNPRIGKLTTTGNITNATISPDGKYIVYAMDEAGKQGLWIRQVAVANSVRLIPAGEVEYRGLCFSKDGDYVYYLLNDRGNKRRRLYQMPALGGSARMINESVDGPVSFSADGERMAFVRTDREQGEDTLMVADDQGKGESEITSRKFPDHLSLRTAPAWSPGGDKLVFTVESADTKGFYMKMGEARVDKSQEKMITPQRWIEIGQITWLGDSSGLMMTAKEEGSSFFHVWFLSYPGGAARQVTSDLSDYVGVSLTSDSRVLATVQSQSLTNIWVALKDQIARPEQITSGAGRYFDLSWTADGKLLYASDVGGSADIFEMQDNGTDQRQLTAGAGRNYAPVCSPDGRYVVFHSNRSGHWNIWRMDRDGSNPVALTAGDDESNWPDVSPDNKWVVYEHVGSGTLKALWRVPLEGGTPERLTSELCTRPCISPDGKWITSWQKNQAPNSTWHIAIFPFTGGEASRRFEVPQSEANGDSTVHWAEDGEAVMYIDYQNGRTKLVSQSLEGGRPEQLVSPTNDLIYAFDRSRDGRIAFSRAVATSDVVLIKDK